jgi:DNA-directed RNA polymerase specialized sigma24 family protein
MAQAFFHCSLSSRDGLFERILRTLQQMPPELRDIFVLSHYEGRCPREIAASLSMEEGDISRRLKEANALFLRIMRSNRTVR